MHAAGRTRVSEKVVHSWVGVTKAPVEADRIPARAVD